MSAPLVSVVTATYNRSNVLRYTLESVRDSTLRDWELLVVGDACTDDTDAVVASFRDPRIRFCNLARNTGEQSGPNNEGVRLARGRYLAFLNHDDLWFPDHLETAVGALEEKGADLVFTAAATVTPRGVRGPFPPEGERYDPTFIVPASRWVFRREMAHDVGPWRHFRALLRVPSQDWLHRAWRAGKVLRGVPRLTVLALPSGARRGSYALRESEENLRWLERMRREPGLRAELARRMAGYDVWSDSAWPRAHRAAHRLYRLYERAFVGLGMVPPPLSELIRFRRRGGHIDRLRRTRGLPPKAVHEAVHEVYEAEGACTLK